MSCESCFTNAACSLCREKMDLLKARIEKLGAFDFGKAEPMVSPFAPPPVYPRRGSHPRLYVTPETLAQLKANLSHPENRAMYEKYIELSETDLGTLLDEPGEHEPIKMSYDTMTVIESKAFRYLVTGEELYGYEAILAIQNYVRAVDIHAIWDVCRAYGFVMYTIALVYDWCFDLLTAGDRERLLAAVETRLATHLEVPYPPKGEGGGVTGHGTESMLYRDWLSVAIAVADEYPDVYELVAGKLFSSHRDGVNYYLQSGAHWQGSSYAPYRYQFLMMAQILFGKMTNGEFSFFSDGLHSVGHFLIQTLRPDGNTYPMGDGKGSAEGRAGSIFYAASYFRDPVLKGYAKQFLKDFTIHTNFPYVTIVTPVLFLCLNDPSVVPVSDYREHMPLVAYYGSPRGNILARSDWKDKGAPSVYMKIGETYSANHEHRDAGHFMIYYKGPLATDSGVYDSRYGCKHDFTYLKQTIAHNCMLVYNPAFANMDAPDTRRFYSGGQSIRDFYEPQTLQEWKTKRGFEQTRVIGADHEVTDGKYRWSYLAGDLTGAYDEETVKSYCRYMLSVMTEDSEMPMAFFVLDRVTATDPTFKKTFLLHTQAQPTLDGKTATVVNTKGENSGKLCMQTLLSDVTYTVIGGAKGEIVGGIPNETDREFWVGNQNFYCEDNPDYVPREIVEAGWGRIEVSPTTCEDTSLLLNVMYVTDAENGEKMLSATEIRGQGLVGAEILGKTVLFPESENLLSRAASFETAATEGETEYLIAGLAPGSWRVTLNGEETREVEVSEGGLLCLVGRVGSVSVSPIC